MVPIKENNNPKDIDKITKVLMSAKTEPEFRKIALQQLELQKELREQNDTIKNQSE